VKKMISQMSKVLTNRSQVIFPDRLIEGASLLAISQYVAVALNLVTNILMARLLGPTDYGLVALAVAYPTMLWSFVSVKSMSIITRYVAIFRARREPEKLKGLVKLGYSLDFFVSLILSNSNLCSGVNPLVRLLLCLAGSRWMNSSMDIF